MRVLSFDHEMPGAGLAGQERMPRVSPDQLPVAFYFVHHANPCESARLYEYVIAKGGAVLFVSRGGGLQAKDVDEFRRDCGNGSNRICLVNEPLADVEHRIRVFLERDVSALEPGDPVPWSALDRFPTPDALVAYYLFGLLGDDPSAQSERVALRAAALDEARALAEAAGVSEVRETDLDDRAILRRLLSSSA